VKWLTVRLGGQKWQVELVRKKHPVFEGDNCHGMTVKDKCRIYVAKEYEESFRESTAVHEAFGHASFNVSGVSQMILDLCGGDEEKAHAVEEEMVSRLELVWYPLMCELGFRFPKVNQ
jgi:hypothetical protein